MFLRKRSQGLNGWITIQPFDPWLFQGDVLHQQGISAYAQVLLRRPAEYLQGIVSIEQEQFDEGAFGGAIFSYAVENKAPLGDFCLCF